MAVQPPSRYNSPMNASQTQLVPGRECGGCTACCKELTIDAPELKKPPGILCVHCTGQGCGIYETRPSVCDGFYCGWRQMPLLDDGWRPDRSEILITTATKHIPAGYPPQGLTFELTGSLERVGWPPFLNLVCDLIEDRVPVFLSVRGEPGHVSANIFLNDRLVAAITARDPQRVMNGLLDAVEACLAHLKEKVTSIKLYLPRTRREVGMPDNTAGLPVAGGSEHILVVEDDEGVRAAVVDMLGELGYRISRAENAQGALEVLRRETPDLIFTDVVMPGNIPTREFIRQAQAMHPGVRVLYTSGYTQNSIVHNGKLDDDAVLLSKPYRKDDLARKLRSVFAGTARGAIAQPGPVPSPRGKVLVVEDVALIRVTTVNMVEQLGFPVADAADANEALAILKQDRAIEILLTDLGLPGMNGHQLVEEALKLNPALKVIIASGYSTSENAGDRVRGALYLTKPFDMQQLRRVLEA